MVTPKETIGDVTFQGASAKRSLVDLLTVGLKLIFELVDRSVGGNTVPRHLDSITEIIFEVLSLQEIV